MYERSMFLGQSHPIIGVAGALALAKFSETFFVRAHGIEKQQPNFSIVIKLEESFIRPTMPPALAQIFVIRMLTRDPFAVANLFVYFFNPNIIGLPF